MRLRTLPALLVLLLVSATASACSDATTGPIAGVESSSNTEGQGFGNVEGQGFGNVVADSAARGEGQGFGN